MKIYRILAIIIITLLISTTIASVATYAKPCGAIVTKQVAPKEIKQLINDILKNPANILELIGGILKDFNATVVIASEPPPDAIVLGPTFQNGYWIIIYLPNGVIIAIDPRESGGPSLPV